MRNKPISFQIMRIIILCTLGAMLLFSAIILAFYRSNVIDTLRDSNQQINTQLNSQYTNLYQQMIYIFVQFSSNSDIQTQLIHEPEDQYEYYSMLRDVNDYLQTYNGYFSFINMEIVLQGENGLTYSTIPYLMTEAIEALMAEDFVRLAQENAREIILLPQHGGLTSATQNDRYFVLAKSLQNSFTGKERGMLMLMLAESCFSDPYRDLAAKDDIFVLLTNEGKVISTSDDSLREQTLPELLEVAQTPSDSFRYQNETYIATSQYNASFQLYLLQLSNHSQISMRMQIPLMLLAMLCLLLMVVEYALVGVSVRRITRPIASLAAIMNDSSPKPIVTTLHRLDDSLRTCAEATSLTESFEHMSSELVKYVSELLQAQEAQRVAELNALQYQINPHFLYNTLASVKYLTAAGQTQAAQTSIDSLIHVLRMTLGDARSMIALEDERAIVQSYFQILQLRYSGRLRLTFNLPENCRRLKVPKLLLQPIIENTVFHAFTDETDCGTIDVFISLVTGQLHIEIMDNGMGIPESILKGILSEGRPNRRAFNGVGLKNVNERIQVMFGADYGLKIISQVGYGTQVSIVLPAMEEEKNENAADADYAG